MIYKEGHSSYGHCWIEGDGINFGYMLWMEDQHTDHIVLWKML